MPPDRRRNLDIGDRNPAALVRRPEHGVDDPAGFETGSKVGIERPIGGDALDQLIGLDDLLVVITEADAGDLKFRQLSLNLDLLGAVDLGLPENLSSSAQILLVIVGALTPI